MAHSMEIAANAGVAGVQPTETTTAKKRGRKKADATTEDRPTKRRKAADPSPKKTATVSVSAPTVDNDQAPKQKKGTGRVAKGKANGESSYSRRASIRSEASRKDDSLEPKWKIVAPPKSVNEFQKFGKKPLSAALKPRVWFSDRDELLATLPELSGNKCVNGVSWLLYDTPVILLDESSVCLQLYRKDSDARTLDIVTTRSYTCPLQPPSLLNDPSLITIATDPLPDLKPDLERPIAKLKPQRKHKRQIRTHYPVKMESMHAPIPPSHASEFSMYIPSEPFHQPDCAGPSSYNLAPARWPTVETNHWTMTQADTPFLSQSHQHSAYVPYPPPSHSPPQFVQGSSQQAMAPAPLHPPLEAGPSPPYSVTAQPYVLGDPRSMKRLLIDAGLKVGVGPTHMVDVEQCGPFQFKWLKPEAPKPASPRVELEETSSRSLQPYPVTHPMPFRPVRDMPHSTALPPLEYRWPPLPTLPPEDVWPVHSPIHSPAPPMLHNTVQGCSITPVPPPPTIRHEGTTQPGEDFASSSSIPSPIPPELQALIDAYIFGRPVTIIISKDRLLAHWSLQLPKICEYAVLGFFSILGVEETKLEVDEPNGSGKAKQVGTYGQVRWRFRLRWASGGERSIFPKVDKAQLERPWWDPAPLRPRKPDDKPLPSAPPSEDNFPTTPRYRVARISNQEYKHRHDHLDNIYRCFLPSHLLSEFGSYISDSSFPRGWICRLCGKVNFQAGLRYRVCVNPGCKDPSFKPYALELLLLRDPQDRLPVSLPYNTYPKPMEVTKAKFEGGIQTLSYYLKKKSERPFIKHIFTANLPKLQLLANRILHDIQVGLRICRKAGDNGPYFTYSAQCPSGIMHPNDQDWEKPPSIINVVKNMMVQRARCFAEVDKSRLRINHFEMLAWVTSGTKKSTVPIRAKQRPVVLVSLGADIVLTVLPLSMKDSATLAVQPNDQPVNELAENIGWIGTNPEKDGVGENDETAEIPKEKGKGTGKRKYADRSFVFTLVHGDALVFDGDEFEYSIKREGTSFLLMGSCKDHQ